MQKKTRTLTLVAVFSALSFIIMFFSINIPFFPHFLRLDISDVPAMFLGFLLGPIYGILVVLGKNILHLFISSNLGIGELANFIIGSSLVGVSSLFYYKKNYNLLSSYFWGVLVMGITAIIVNLIVIIPLYDKVLALPISKIISLTSKVNPFVNNIFTYLFLTILPFNLIKGMVITIITNLLYKKLNPISKHKLQGGF